MDPTMKEYRTENNSKFIGKQLNDLHQLRSTCYVWFKHKKKRINLEARISDLSSEYLILTLSNPIDLNLIFYRPPELYFYNSFHGVSFKIDILYFKSPFLKVAIPSKMVTKEKRLFDRLNFDPKDINEIAIIFDQSKKGLIKNQNVLDLSPEGTSFIITKENLEKYRQDNLVVIGQLPFQKADHPFPAKIIYTEQFSSRKYGHGYLYRVGFRFLQKPETLHIPFPKKTA
jgi:hypothetical protein